ncbi:unnamed protein product [Sphagnum balticum]|jgi:hypothetical protein
MRYSFFAKTDKRPKERFFNPPGEKTVDDAAASTGQGQSSGEAGFRMLDTANLSYRSLRLVRPKISPEELLEKLLRNADNAMGLASQHYLEQMLILIKKNPSLVNRVPKNFHSNPLELVIKLGNDSIAQELLQMQAQVRPENRYLLKKIEHLLRPQRSREMRYAPTP